MRKIILVNFVVVLLFLTAIGVCFSASAVETTSQQTQPEKIESAGTGLIKLTSWTGESYYGSIRGFSIVLTSGREDARIRVPVRKRERGFRTRQLWTGLTSRLGRE